MSSLNGWILLVQASIYSNKKDYDDKIYKLRDILASVLDKLIENVKCIFRNIRSFYADNDVEDDGISEITKSTSKTKPSKSYPSIFRNPTKIIKVAHFR